MKKETIIRLAIVVVLILAVLFAMRGNIYKTVVKYEDGGNRKNYELKDKGILNYIHEQLPNDESLDANIDIDMIVDLSLDITANTLDYFAEAETNDPHEVFIIKNANYIGYAAFTASVGNYLLKRFEMSKEWEAKPKKGKLYRFGSNKTKGAKEGWYKDHDFVIFRNKNTKEEIYVDPSAYESYGVSRVNKYQK
ncbi:MAG: hypothetical protein E6767_08120 [Dysgonomonas sp.]|nr:hypothetical protein [Dysgonomonas sp.]